jgi:hypothetical protein
MIFLITALSFFNIPDGAIREGDVQSWSIRLHPHESFTISATSGTLFVYFIHVFDIQMSIYADGSLFHTITNDYDIAGIDFGSHHGRIVFSAIQETALMISAIAFPNVCQDLRIVASQPRMLLNFSSESTDPISRITHGQRLCIWAANPIRHLLNIRMDTERGFDILKMFRSEGMITAFSGQSESTVVSNGGLDYFVWETDGDGLSRAFSIGVEDDHNSLMNQELSYPAFRANLQGSRTSDVSLIFVHSDSGDEGSKTESPTTATEATASPGSESGTAGETLVPAILGLTVVLTVLAVAAIAWSVKECLAYRADFGTVSGESPPARPNAEQGASGEYQPAGDESSMPDPYFAGRAET